MRNRSQKKTLLTSLIAIAILTSSCAHANGSKHLGHADGMTINADNPPKSGVWMTWDDARAMANYQRNARTECRESVLLCKKEVENLKLSNESMANSIKRDNNGSWWSTWGFPIGIITGVLVGAIIPISIIGVGK